MVNLDKVNSFAKFYEAGNPSTSRISDSHQQRPSGLDEAEQTMINKAFPQSKSQALSVYLSDGRSHTERPDARGNHIDFRI